MNKRINITILLGLGMLLSGAQMSAGEKREKWSTKVTSFINEQTVKRYINNKKEAFIEKFHEVKERKDHYWIGGATILGSILAGGFSFRPIVSKRFFVGLGSGYTTYKYRDNKINLEAIKRDVKVVKKDVKVVRINVTDIKETQKIHGTKIIESNNGIKQVGKKVDIVDGKVTVVDGKVSEGFENVDNRFNTSEENQNNLKDGHKNLSRGQEDLKEGQERLKKDVNKLNTKVDKNGKKIDKIDKEVGEVKKTVNKNKSYLEMIWDHISCSDEVEAI